MNYVGNCIIVFQEEGFELFSVLLIQHIKIYELFLKVYFVSWYLVKVEKYLYSCSLLIFLLLLDILCLMVKFHVSKADQFGVIENFVACIIENLPTSSHQTKFIFCGPFY